MTSQLSTNKKLSYVLCILFCIYGLGDIWKGEKIPANHGFGFDGAIYGQAAKAFYGTVIHKQINRHHLHRIFPSGVIYGCLKILGIKRTNETIIKAFGIYNLILILLSIYLWFHIARMLQLPDRLALLGLISFLFNYGIMKFNFYYPVLTDTTAFFLGFLTLWGYLNKNNMVMLLCTLAGSFTWPTIIYTIPLLQIFKRNQTTATDHDYTLRYVIITSLILLWCGIGFYTHYFSSLENNVGVEVYAWLLPFGTMCFIAYLFFAFNYILDFNISHALRTFYKNLNITWIVIYAGLIIGLSILAKSYPPPLGVTFYQYVGWISLGAMAKPFYSLLSHIVYYGPIVILAVFVWKKISYAVQIYGLGLVFFFCFYLVQSIDPEARHLMFFFPFFVTFTMVSVKECNVSSLFLAIYSIIALGLSKCWFIINTDEFVRRIKNIGFDFKEMYDPVLQRYFMHSGAYMNFTSYLLQGAVVLLCGAILFTLYAKTDKLCRNSQ